MHDDGDRLCREMPVGIALVGSGCPRFHIQRLSSAQTELLGIGDQDADGPDAKSSLECTRERHFHDPRSMISLLFLSIYCPPFNCPSNYPYIYNHPSIPFSQSPTPPSTTKPGFSHIKRRTAIRPNGLHFISYGHPICWSLTRAVIRDYRHDSQPSSMSVAA